MFPLTLADHIIFGILAIVLPLFAIFKVSPQASSIPKQTKLKIKLYWLNSGVLCFGGLVILVLWFVTGRSWSEMGWRGVSGEWFPEWILVTAFFLLLYMFDTFLSWNETEQHPASALLPQNWKEFAHFGSIVSLSAGFCEEIVFRGFLITYLMTLFSASSYAIWIAISLSSLIFAVLHAYQGGVAILKITFLTFMFGGIFVMTKSLWPVIILHFSVDFIGGLLATLFSLSAANGQIQAIDN
jgi:CAAX protease family protein